MVGGRGRRGRALEPSDVGDREGKGVGRTGRDEAWVTYAGRRLRVRPGTAPGALGAHGEADQGARRRRGGGGRSAAAAPAGKEGRAHCPCVGVGPRGEAPPSRPGLVQLRPFPAVPDGPGG